METTLTMAGQQALAGAARLRAGSGVISAYAHLHASSWTVGTLAEPTTFAMVFDGKNRPTRQPSELSP